MPQFLNFKRLINLLKIVLFAVAQYFLFTSIFSLMHYSYGIGDSIGAIRGLLDVSIVIVATLTTLLFLIADYSKYKLIFFTAIGVFIIAHGVYYFQQHQENVRTKHYHAIYNEYEAYADETWKYLDDPQNVLERITHLDAFPVDSRSEQRTLLIGLALLDRKYIQNLKDYSGFYPYKLDLRKAKTHFAFDTEQDFINVLEVEKALALQADHLDKRFTLENMIEKRYYHAFLLMLEAAEIYDFCSDAKRNYLKLVNDITDEVQQQRAIEIIVQKEKECVELKAKRMNIDHSSLYQKNIDYPYVASEKRKAVILQNMNKLERGMSKEQLIALMTEPDEVNLTFKFKREKIEDAIGFSFVYILRRNNTFGSVVEKAEQLIRIHFDQTSKLIWAYSIAVDNFKGIENIECK